MRVVNNVFYHIAKLKNRIAPGLTFRSEEWSIEVLYGSSPFALNASNGSQITAMTGEQVRDTTASFVADPFLVQHEGAWYMFFEALETPSDRGIICAAFSNDGLKWTYAGIVLRENFHLSYPYTFKKGRDYFMVPETAQADAVRLYKCDRFPMQWSFVGNLISGKHRDPSLVWHNGMWWLFSQSDEGEAMALRLHFAPDLDGAWVEHPQSPVLRNNPHHTRPGGRILQFDDRLFRIAQDTFPEYGLQLFAFEILELTPTSYSERIVDDRPILKGRGHGFFREKIHHLDAQRLPDGSWFAAIDRSCRELRPRWVRQKTASPQVLQGDI
jgi:hypothetical protein